MQKACRNGRPVRIRIRRVRDEDRKRAARACRRCKARKNKCIEGPDGICQRCLQGAHECVYGPGEAGEARPREARPREVREVREVSDARPKDKEVPPENGFLSRLREAFSLEALSAQPRPQADLDVADQLRPEAMALSSRGPPAPAVSAGPDTHRLRQAVAGFPPRRIGEFLLAVCIEQGLDSFFYFDQAALTADLARFYEGSDRLRHDPVFVCLALSVFALGSQWTALARPAWAREQHVLGPDPAPGQMIYGLAHSLVPDLLERPCVRSVQAALVMGVYLAPANVLTATYVYLGLALRMAMALGMHLEDEDSPLTEYEAEVRRRLWWTAFSLERTLTLKLNRPRSVAQAAITARLPRSLPAMDGRQRFDNLPHQLASAQLVRIQDRQTEMPADAFLAELKRWKRSLPACLRLDNVRPHDRGYRAVVHLHMHYYHAKISLFKIAVVRTVRMRLRAALGGQGQDQEEQDPEGAGDRYPWEVCRRAASKTLGLFRQLAESRSMTRFSYTDFQGCSLATIAELVAGVLERDADYEERVQKLGMGCLRLMAEGNATAKRGVRFVEAVAAIAEEARERLCRATAAAATTTTTDERRPAVAGGADGESGSSLADEQAAEYSRWAEWVVKTGGAVEEEPLPESLTALPDLFAMEPQHLPFQTLQDQSYLMDLTGLGVLNFGSGEWEFP